MAIDSMSAARLITLCPKRCPVTNSFSIVAIIIGIQGIIVGVVSLVMAFKGGGVGIAILGLVSILFGIVLLINPILSALALVLVLAAFAIVGGVASIVMAFRLRPAG